MLPYLKINACTSWIISIIEHCGLSLTARAFASQALQCFESDRSFEHALVTRWAHRQTFDAQLASIQSEYTPAVVCYSGAWISYDCLSLRLPDEMASEGARRERCHTQSTGRLLEK